MLAELYRRVRRATTALAAPLAIEDQVVQTMPEVSPTKWHLAHTSWFFETFVLGPGLPNYRPLDVRYATLFNSYYHAAGPRWAQSERGWLSRPTVAEIAAYRAHVDRAMERFFARADPAFDFVVELGINHEEQHQELILTDCAHVLALNPLAPAYVTAEVIASPPAVPLAWTSFAGGLVEVGCAPSGFAFDNERPRHRAWLEPFRLANRAVTAGEYLQFVAERGYERPELWLSDGWDRCRREGWQAPLYWTLTDDGWCDSTLAGPRPVDIHAPVAHVCYYEADAFARWAGARLPTEAEWELGSATAGASGRFLESGVFMPAPAPDGMAQLFGDVWEWTSSPYLPYPGYTPFAGALGEYNGKFMSSRMVLRGGSCLTPERHLRPSYRNFWAPETRWQMAGIRLAQ